MYIYEDKMALEAAFPFHIGSLVLKTTENKEDSFHWHAFCEITYILQGRGSYYVNGKRYGMEAGDLIIFNNAEPHGWWAEEDMHVLVMVFGMDWIAETAGGRQGSYLEVLAKQGSSFRNRIPKEDAADIAAMMLDGQREYQWKQIGYERIIQANLMKILTYLFRYYQKTEEAGGSLTEKMRDMARLEAAFTYIGDHYHEKITLRDAAKAAYMSPSYFSAFFKKVTNAGFCEYVTKFRMKKVEERLAVSEDSIMEIAMACGFYNMSNFYRLYKKYRGDTARLKEIREKKR